MATQYYYTRNGERQGPVSADRLKVLAAHGQLAREDLVWKEGMTEWVAASKLKGLFPSTTTPMPVVEPAPAAVPPPVAPAAVPPPPAVLAPEPTLATPELVPAPIGAGGSMPAAELLKKPIVWIIAGAGAAFMLLMLVLVVVVIAVWAGKDSNGGGGGGGSGSSSKFVGSWKSRPGLAGLRYVVEFKSSGTFTTKLYNDKQLIEGLGGTWKLTRSESNRYVLRIVYDNNPDDEVGWTVISEDDGTIRIVGLDGLYDQIKFDRQK